MPMLSGSLDLSARPVRPPHMQWDGRLDNRSDLALTLGLDHALEAADVARAVFAARGIPGLERLVGDWSLVLWDDGQGGLHLARDYMGARPLYFCVEGRRVSWSSDLGELVLRCERRDALSDTFPAAFMSLRPQPAVTPYEGVHAVPPGACVTFSPDGEIRTRSFWTLATGDIRYARPERYDEELQALWRDAVGARLQADGTVWAELSGGLDSSSVVCMADRLIRAGSVRARALRLVSHATLQSPEGDERRFIAEVERQVGVATELVGVEDHQSHTDPERAWVTPYALQGVGLETVNRVRAGGGRIVLSGRLGDAIMGCQPDNSETVFDDLRRGRLVGALSSMRAWSRATRKPFIEIACRLLAPASSPPDTGANLLTSPLQTLLHDLPRIDDVAGVRRSKRALARLVLGYSRGGRLQIPLYPNDVLYTYPFSHRPLVEFVLAIPGDQLSAPGVTRALMRRAFAGLLPPRILNRQSKGYYPPAAFRAARRQVADIIDVRRLEAVQRGWIDADRLRQSLRAFTEGGGDTGGDIHLVLRLERWLQARRQIPAIPLRKEVNDHAVLNA